MPKVSIVLPTYNGEKYIRESIESILCQTMTDWELIIVNDCSTDSTPLIIKEYAARDDRIKVVTNLQNQKLPESLNIGFRQAHGEYLTWTSDDNMYKPQALEIMAEYLDKNTDCPMVCTAMDIIDSESRYLYTKSECSLEDALCNNCIGACFMYTKNVLTEIGEYCTERFLVEDYDYWLRIIFKYGRIDFINKIEYYYREHDKSLTGKRRREIDIQLFKLRRDYIDKIINALKFDKRRLSQLYFEYGFKNYNDEYVKCRIYENVKELEIVCKDEIEGDMVVYGAGNIGMMAYARYGTQIKYYVDRNKKLVGQNINNIPIMSIDSLPELNRQYSILVAAGPEKIFEFIKYLYEQNIEKCYVFYP